MILATAFTWLFVLAFPFLYAIAMFLGIPYALVNVDREFVGTFVSMFLTRESWAGWLSMLRNPRRTLLTVLGIL